MSTSEDHFAPLPSLILGAAGGALVGGRPRRSTAGALAAIAGLALVGFAARRPMAQALRRAGTRRRSVRLRLSFVVPHPVGEVFKFCSDFENFPKFVRALRAVEDFGDGRSHWVGSTPSGGTLEWDALTTKFVTNRVIAWENTPRSPVRMNGTIRFVPERTGETCLKVALDYSAPTDRIADAVAALATRTLNHELETDIRRLGETLDDLRASAPAAQIAV
ncbi:MAG TPA: SRPBCC family protein [Gemmatimonadaceae bacterium]